jgi:aminopeptidase N
MKSLDSVDLENPMRPLRYSASLVQKAFLLALAVALLASSNFVLAQQAQTQKQPLPPTQYIPSRNYDTRHIALNLRFDWEREQALGTATITFIPTVPDVRTVEFDAANMTFNSVKLASGTVLRHEADVPKQKLRITLDRTYQPKDVLTVVIDYRTNGIEQKQGLPGFGRGLAFIKPTPDNPTRPKQIWSQGQTEYNHLWFPCFDHPNDFATSEMIATVEKPLMVISNGRLLETKNNPDNTRTFHWKMEQPHASYLTSIVVGEYVPIETRYEGIPIITYVYPNEVEEGKVTQARLNEMVKFFSEVTGIKYPYAKYAQTVARDFGGGMENITATTQTDQMIHDARSTLDGDWDGLQSHELAHQWFGDLLTCRHWSDIWLNESFATYFQALWDEHRLGRDEFLYLDVKGNQDAYYTDWRNGRRRPIVTTNYRDPDAVFDNYAYPRGGAVLHMLRKALGEENWWRSINHYLRKYAHQPVQTEQFRIAIEETTGQPMDWFFDQWLYKMGHPVFNVTKAYDATAKTLIITVRQEQKPDPNSDYPQAQFFRTPIEIEIGTNANTRIERVLLEAKEEQKLTFNVDAEPLLVNFDYGNTLIKELKFVKPNAELVYQLTRDEDVMGRMWALDQLSARMKDKATAEADKQQIAEAISTALTSDKAWPMRVEAAQALNGWQSNTARLALTRAAKDKSARVRARALSSLAAYKDAELASIFLEHLKDPSYATIRAAARGLGQTKTPAAYDALVKLLEVPSWRNTIRASALHGLADLGDRRALELGLRYAAKENPAPVRAAAVMLLASVGKDDPRVFQLITEAFAQSVAARNFTLGTATADAIVNLGDTRGMEVFEQVIKKLEGSPDLQGFIRIYQRRLQQSLKPPATPKPAGQ